MELSHTARSPMPDTDAQLALPITPPKQAVKNKQKVKRAIIKDYYYEIVTSCSENT